MGESNAKNNFVIAGGRLPDIAFDSVVPESGVEVLKSVSSRKVKDHISILTCGGFRSSLLMTDVKAGMINGMSLDDYPDRHRLGAWAASV